MSRVANVNRKASAEAIIQLVKTLKIIAGLAIQGNRAYESPGRASQGLTQTKVEKRAGVSQATISRLENGEIPRDKLLKQILRESGFNMAKKGGGHALFQILAAIRRNEGKLEKLLKEPPR